MYEGAYYHRYVQSYGRNNEGSGKILVDFVCICVKTDVNNKLKRFVSITKDKKKEWYQVTYEKLLFSATIVVPWGIDTKSVGIEHDESKLEQV